MTDLTQNGASQPEQTGTGVTLTWSTPVVEEWIQVDVKIGTPLIAVGEGSTFSMGTGSHAVPIKVTTSGFYDPIVAVPGYVSSGQAFDLQAAGCQRGFNTDAFNPDAFAWTDFPFSMLPAFDELQFDSDAYQATTINKAVFMDSGEVYAPVQQTVRMDIFPAFLECSDVLNPNAQNTAQFFDELLHDDGLVFTPNAFNRIQEFQAAVAFDAGSVYNIANILTPTQFFTGATYLDAGSVFTNPVAFNLKQVFTGAAYLDAGTTYTDPTAFNLKQVFTGAAYLDAGSVFTNPVAFNLKQVFTGTPVGFDPYDANVVGLLNFNDSYADAKGHTVTAYDNVSLSTSTKKSGTSSLSITAYGHITISDGGDFSFPGDYTVEFWHTGNTVGGCVFSNNAYTYLYNGTLYINDSAVISGLSSALNASGSWMHVAITRTGSTVRIFKDGVQIGSGTSSSTHNFTNLVFGRYEPRGNSGVSYTGNVDNIRITKGVCRYSSDFAFALGNLFDDLGLPLHTSYNWDQFFTASLINSGSVDATGAILNMQMQTLSDASGHSITNNGVTIASAVPIDGNYAAFNGTSAYFSSPASADWAFGTGDFTIELWTWIDPANTSRLLTNCANQTGANGTWGLNYSSTGLSFTEVVSGEPGVSASGLSLASAWHHIAVTRSGTTLRIFVDGKIKGSGTFSTNLNNTSYPLWVGTSPNENYFKGSMDGIKIYKGFAKYTSEFDPYGETFSPNAFNYDQFFNGTLLDDGTVGTPTAFNWKTFVDPVFLDTGTVYTNPAAYNWTVELTHTFMDVGAVYADPVVYRTLQDYWTSLLNFSSVYDIDDIKVMRAIADPVHVSDGTIYTPDVYNALQIFTGAIVDQSVIQAPDAFNLKQIATFNTIVNDSAINAPNALNIDQYLTDLLLDAGTVYTNPVAFNLKQVFTGVTIEAASVYNPDVWNKKQVFTGAAVHDPWSIYAPAAQNFDNYYPAVLVDSGTASSPNAFNLTQIFTGANAYEAFTAYNPSADVADRRYSFDMLDPGSVGTPSAANKNQWATPAFVDAASVYTPNASKTLLDKLTFNLLDAGSIFNPTQTNWDSIISIGTIINQSMVYDDYNASTLLQTFLMSLTQDDAVLLPSAENRNRMFTASTDLFGEVYAPESALNVDREFTATLIQDSNVYDPDNADIMHRTFAADVCLDVFGVYDPQKAFNVKQVMDAALLEAGSVNNPTVAPKTAADAACLFQAGEQIVSFNLTTFANIRMVAFAYPGEEGKADMTTYAPASMGMAAYSGEQASASLIDAYITFSNIVGYGGTAMIASTMATEPLIFHYAGESAEAGLMTEMIVSAEFGAGENVGTALDVHPSFSIGVVTFWNDTFNDATITTQYAGAAFRPHVIGVSEEMRMSFDRPWELDMALDECCNPPFKTRLHQNVNVEMNNADDLFEVYYGDKLWASASLSNSIFFRARAYEGTNMRMQDTPVFELGDNKFRASEEMACVFTLTNPIWELPLCKGNFVGQGSDVQIEMLDLLDDIKCEEYRMIAGEEMIVHPTLCTESRLPAVAGDGSSGWCDLYIQQWSAYTWSDMGGAYCTLSHNVILNVGNGFQAGESAVAEFENPFITGYMGESAQATMTIHHVVNFLEQGGLSNEHLVVKADGSPDFAQSFVIAIEGYYFRHDLKSRSR